jgi:Contractile injection system tube protein
MSSPKVISPNQKSAQLQKAKLIAYNKEAPDIELMFNPDEISFTRTVKWDADPGNRGDHLLPKVNFSGVDPYKLTLKQLLFDTYESKESVMKYVDIIKKSVERIQEKADSRPPVYIFEWGVGERKSYFHCVVTSLTYKLTMFLTDGTPVRAIVDISLQEVDQTNLPGTKASASKKGDRTKGATPVKSTGKKSAILPGVPLNSIIKKMF